MESLTFDRAVSFYDKTRALPDWVSTAVTDSIINLARLSPASRVLEVGIGTGRIALPLLKRGVPMVGVDLSLPMMNEFQKKIATDEVRVSLAQTDANVLPFPNACFDCVYAVHVYHLVANWQNALTEAWRVVKLGGNFLVTYHRRDPQSPNRKIRRQLFDLVKARGITAERPGAQSYDELKTAMQKLGTTQLIEVARWHERTIPVAQILDEIQARLFSETWMIPEKILEQVMPALREWTQKEFGSLGYKVREEEEFMWLVTRK